MKKLLKIAPLSLIAVCALASCDGTSSGSVTSEENHENWWAEFNALHPEDSVTLSEEEAKQIFEYDFFGDYNSPTYTSRVDSCIVYQPPSLFNASHLDEGQYLVQQDAIYYYNNNVARVTGSYYHRGYDGVTTRDEMNEPPYPTGLEDEEDGTIYEYNEYLYTDDTTNTMNCIYTRDNDKTDIYSFYKSVDFDWTSWDNIYTYRENQGTMWESLSNDVLTYFNQYRALYADDGYTESTATYYGDKSVNRYGNTTLQVGFRGTITILPLYSAWKAGWTEDESYRYIYIERFLEYDIRIYITDGNVSSIYYNFNGLMGQQYVDQNQVQVTPETNADGEYINYEVDDELLSQLDLVEGEEETIYPNLYQYAFSYSDYGDFDTSRIVTEGYRESGPDDVGDNYFFNIAQDM